jgi:patatin-like phospholipase/acyl hydrolase
MATYEGGAGALPRRRILAIDGGGLLGTYPAAFLAGLESHLPHPIGRYFDLIAGTSTGGIIAIGLAMGMRASDILALYERKGAAIFGQHHSRVVNWLLRKWRIARWAVRPKYSSDALREALVDVLGEKLIGDATQRLLIPAWSPVSRSVYIYKTAHHLRLNTDYKERAVDAALATAAAPTYFRRHLTENDVGLIDGGVWANNPTGLAVVEAITLLNWPRESLHVLSLGCLDETYTFSARAGVGNLGLNLLKLFMDGQSRGAMGIAKLLTGHEHEREAIHRIDQCVPHGAYGMDDARVIRELKGLGHEAARSRYPALRPIFFDEPAAPFEPVYRLPSAVPVKQMLPT